MKHPTKVFLNFTQLYAEVIIFVTFKHILKVGGEVKITVGFKRLNKIQQSYDAEWKKKQVDC